MNLYWILTTINVIVWYVVSYQAIIFNVPLLMIPAFAFAMVFSGVWLGLTDNRLHQDT